jgi:hypothetical protein
MFRADRSLRSVARALPALALLLGSLAVPAPSWAGPAEQRAPAAPARPSADGQALLERYTAQALTDAVLLRPREEGSAVRSIEITSDGEVLVNGKEFDEAEIRDFLGEDGRRLVALSQLDFDPLREALGVAPEAPQAGAPEATGAPGVRGVPPVPSVPPVPRVPRVRSSRDDRVSVGNSVHIAEDESARDVVCIGCSITVDGEAFGDLVAVGGSVSVTGLAHGDAVAIGGSVAVGSTAEVDGEATAVGGTVNVEEGGQVHGGRSSVGIGDSLRHGLHNKDWSVWALPFGVFSDGAKLVRAIFRTGLLALLGVLAFLLLRPAIDRAERRATVEPWKAVFAGLLLQLLFFPVLLLVTVILAISIIGIPLLALVPVALLAFLVAALMGFVAVGHAVGGWIERRRGHAFSSAVLAVVVGILLIQATGLVGRVVALPGGVFGALGFALVALGFFLKYAAWTVGMGAVTLTALGRDWRRPEPEIAAAPRPEPEPGPGTEAPDAAEPPPPPPPPPPDGEDEPRS